MAERNGSSRRGRRNKRPVRWTRILLLLFLIALMAGIGLGAGFVLNAVRAMPHIEDVRPQPQVTSFVYDSNGEKIAPLRGPEHRIIVEFSEIPEVVRNAFIAVEDHRFYDHFGMDIYRTAGAFWYNLKNPDSSLQGGSTISQQLARNAWPIGMEQTYQRKVQEAFLAIQLERTYTKDQILTMYLNQINLGHGAYGVQAAAQIYFGKDLSELTLAEAAMIAGLPQAPSHLSPYVDMEKAVNRRSIVLSTMVREGYITEEQQRQAEREEVKLIGLPQGTESEAGHFMDYVLSQLLERYDAAVVYGGGIHVYTTLDRRIQDGVEEAIRTQLDADFPLGEFEKDLQVGVVVIDPFTGHVKAMVGGREHNAALEHNRVSQTYRQPGSAFKPVAVYTAALEAGWSPATVIDDAPVEFQLTTERFAPRNYSETGWPLGAYRGLTTMREAIRRSVNIPAVRTLTEIGVDTGFETAQRLGITSLVPDGPTGDRNPSLALGGLTKGVSPLELTMAYSTFAAGGIRPDPIAITRIVDRHGNVLEENEPQRTVAISPQVAYLMTDMLRSVVVDNRSGWISNWGTGWRAELSGDWPVAGKTGTTDDTIDLWWVGYTPMYAAAVWLGFDEPESIPDIVGMHMPSGLYPALIWRDLMEVAHEGVGPLEFERPPDLVERTICIKSGKLPGEHCPPAQQRRELFIQGTEPLETCEVHVPVEVCSSHPNLLWDPYCPEGGHPVEKVFLDRPVLEEPVVDNRGRTLPMPWDMADVVPTETCVDVYGSREDLAETTIELTVGPRGFVPTILQAKQDQLVILEVSSTDGSHLIVIEGLGIEVEVTEEETARVTFTPEQAGVFRMYCEDHYPQNRNEQGRFMVTR
ncbi:MAG: PBP1A family penicillin-binding protein [Bacillota bacterium]